MRQKSGPEGSAERYVKEMRSQESIERVLAAGARVAYPKL